MTFPLARYNMLFHTLGVGAGVFGGQAKQEAVVFLCCLEEMVDTCPRMHICSFVIACTCACGWFCLFFPLAKCQSSRLHNKMHAG